MRQWAKPLLALVLVAAVALVIANINEINPARIEAEVRALGFWGPMAFFAIYVLSMVVLGSASVLNLAGGALFGPIWGMALNSAALFAGGVAGFCIGRYLAKDFVQRRTGRRLKRILDGVENEGWRFVTFVRLVPIFHYASISYGLGATRLRFREFAIPTAICLIPSTFAFTWVGHTGRAAASSTGDLVTNILLALGIMGLVALIPHLMMRSRRRNGIEYEAMIDIHQTGQPITILIVSAKPAPLPSATDIDAETIADGTLGDWIKVNHERVNVPFIVAAENESLALKTARQIRKGGFSDVRYLFGGTKALSDHANPRGWDNNPTPTLSVP